MRVLNKELENKELNKAKLLNYGFIIYNNDYIYEKQILDNSFKVIVTFSKKELTSKIIDLSTNEEYFLVDIKNITGDFVGKVKNEYEKVLKDIIDYCSTKNVFKNNQTKEIMDYIESKYNDKIEYLWEKFPNCAIYRHKENNKWYALIVTITKNKLGIESNEEVEIIDLKYPKDKIKDVIDNKNIFPGYHMKKKIGLQLY